MQKPDTRVMRNEDQFSMFVVVCLTIETLVDQLLSWEERKHLEHRPIVFGGDVGCWTLRRIWIAPRLNCRCAYSRHCPRKAWTEAAPTGVDRRRIANTCNLVATWIWIWSDWLLCVRGRIHPSAPIMSDSWSHTIPDQIPPNYSTGTYDRCRGFPEPGSAFLPCGDSTWKLVWSTFATY